MSLCSPPLLRSGAENVWTEFMAGYAGDALDFEYAAVWHLSPAAPVRNHGRIVYAELCGGFRKTAECIDGLINRGACRIHAPFYHAT